MRNADQQRSKNLRTNSNAQPLGNDVSRRDDSETDALGGVSSDGVAIALASDSVYQSNKLALVIFGLLYAAATSYLVYVCIQIASANA